MTGWPKGNLPLFFILKRMAFAFLACLVVTSSPLAHERLRPESPETLVAGTENDPLVRVVDAKVAWVNYAALRRDFPQLSAMTDPQIDGWILEHFAWISRKQLTLNGIRNSEIPTSPNQEKIGFRPPEYDRAAILEAFDSAGRPIGLVDIKGIGHKTGNGDPPTQVAQYSRVKDDPTEVDKLRLRDHSDGLLSFGEAIAEVSRQRAVQMLFDLANHRDKTDYQTVESYFIIALPFTILKDKGGSIPAALCGRQPHWGRSEYLDIPPLTYMDERGKRQRSSTDSAVDFGAAIVIDPRLESRFGIIPGGDENDPQQSKPWSWGHETANAFVRGDTMAVKQHFAYMLAPIQAEWEALQIAKQPQLPPPEHFRTFFQKNPRGGSNLLGSMPIWSKTFWSQVPALLNDPDRAVRTEMALALEKQKIWPEAVWKAIPATMRDTSDAVRRSISCALKGKPGWTPAVWQEIPRLMNDIHSVVRMNIGWALEKQPRWPNFVWQKIPALMQDPYAEARVAIFAAIEKQVAWPPPVWHALTTTLTIKNDASPGALVASVTRAAASALRDQEIWPQAIWNNIPALLLYKDYRVRGEIASVLQHQHAWPAAVWKLAPQLLNDDEIPVQEAIRSAIFDQTTIPKDVEKKVLRTLLDQPDAQLHEKIRSLLQSTPGATRTRCRQSLRETAPALVGGSR